MEANNAETSTEQTNQAVGADTTGTTETTVIEAGDTATGEQSSSVESTEQSASVSDLVYDFDGEEVSTSTMMEWKKGHMLQADYTKKSQANAEARKANEAKALELDGLHTTLTEKIAELNEAIEAGSNAEDLDDLRENNTGEYLKRMEQIEAKKKLAKQAADEQKALNDKQSGERLLVEQQLLNDSNPSWVDPKVKEADIALVETYIKDAEFNDDDFNALQNHKLMNMALNAARYTALQKETAETEKAVEKAPNVVKARPKTTPKPKTRAERFYGNN